MTVCELKEELNDAKEIIGVFREANVSLENELYSIKEKLSDIEDLCDVLLLIENRSVKILAGIMKQRISGKRNVPAG